MSVTTAEIIELYVASFGRAPRKSELEALETASAGKTKSEVAADMIESSGSFASADNTAFLNEAYQAFFGRVADAEGLAFWGAALEAGLSRADLIAELVAGADNYPAEGANAAEAAKDKAIAANKKAVATYFAESGIEDEAQASELLDGVTEDPATVDSAKDVIDEATQVPGETFTLVSGAEVVEGTAGNDTIIAVTDNLASKRTLDQGDQIDGGEGNDVLKVALGANFSGFTGDGFLKNVQTVELTNSSNFARTFNSTKTEGITTYVLNATGNRIDLTHIQSVDNLTVNVNSQKEGNVNIGFATGVVTGTDDSMTLGLNGVGTARAGTACNPVAAKYATVVAAGIEHLQVNAEGANFVNLADAATKTITVAGSGALTVGDVADSITSFDASAAAGKVTAGLTKVNAAGRLAEVKFGQVTSAITVNADGLNIVAAVEGGAGVDTLNIVAPNDRTLALNMTDVEVVTATVTAGKKLTFSGETVDGLERVNYAGAGDLTLANMQTEALLLQLNNNSIGKVIYDGYGDLTIQTATQPADPCPDNAQPGEKAANTSSAGVVAANATTVTFNVLAYSTYSGDLVASAAEVVTLNIASSKASKDFVGTTKGDQLVVFDGTVDAAAATQVIIDAKGEIDGATINAGKAESMTLALGEGSIVLNTPALAEIAITAVADDFEILAGSDLSELAAITATNISGDLEIAADMVNLQQATFIGTGSVVISGLVGEDAESVEINASALIGAFEVVLDDYVFGTGNLGSASVIGSRISENTITIGAGRDEITVVGGVSNDTIEIDMTEGGTAQITTGSGDDEVTIIAADTNNSAVVTITDFTIGTDKLVIGNTGVFADALMASTEAAGDVADLLNEFSGISGATATNIKSIEIANGTSDQAAILYNGNVYLIAGDGTEDKTTLIELVGASGYTELADFTG